MPTLQELADIAGRYDTAMADAMIVACIQRHYRTGEPLRMRKRVRDRLAGKAPMRQAPARVIYADLESEEWERIMRENGDTRWNHC